MADKGVGSRLSAIFLLVLLVISIGMMQLELAEGRTCKTPSGKFKGVCASSNNCKNVCQTEGFPSGSCDFHVANRKCYCSKPCP
uniref:Putative gamma-thionin protein n=1 Tax=Picea abies TaxID=3329 RepID=Q40779_PICAB|nr:putative gamma-thionin protein [Picea abies]